ncbi:MAG: SDR family oxidoreductase [Gemmatimonadaceae bacterium]
MTADSGSGLSVSAPRPLALVTGASSGIGSDLAELLAVAGYDLVLTARRLDRLSELADRLAAAHGVTCTPLAADLVRASECDRVIAFLSPDKKRFSILVNNAGFGSHGFFHEISLEIDLEMIDVNCRALTHITKGVLPWMIANRQGRVLNIASVAAFQPGPLMAVYYASKAFVLSLSEALSNECAGTGVTVTASCPGPTVTEFAGAAGFRSDAPTSGAPAMSSKVVAQLSFDAMMRGARVEVTGSRNKFVAFMSRLLPRRFVLSTVRSIQEKRRRDREGGV